MPDRGGARVARFTCLECGGALDEAPDAFRCTSCNRSWPVRDGVPRFFEPDYYWGELSEQDASQFLGDVREHGWRSAVGRRFASDSDMRIGLTDWQRASWLPMLGLPENAVGLDIGSGYGAITHAMSRHVGTVYSLEAIPERIEFTRLRLEQEGVRNVRLVQGTGLRLPFGDESFDLVVVNGVLEWVGEWRVDVSPREVQLGFLRGVHRVLRPGGLILVGIENRFGLQFLLGGRDHSGLAYTSLVPRWMASAILRFRGNYFRGRENRVRRSYRTYTYTQRGYGKLLSDGGFRSADFFWPDPGYNQPYSVIPLRHMFAAEHVVEKLVEPSQSWRRGWKRKLKNVFAVTSTVDFFVADFLIAGEKEGAPGGASWRHRAWAQLRAKMPDLPAVRDPSFSLSTRPYGRKSLIRVFEADATFPEVMLKVSTSAPGAAEATRSEYAALATAVRQHRLTRSPLFFIPEPLGVSEVGSFVFAAESIAPGRPLSQLVFSAHPSNRRAILSRMLGRAIEISVAVARMLRGVDAVPEASAGWRDLPADLHDESAVVRMAMEAQARWPDRQGPGSWGHHGDFTIENLFFTQGDDPLSTIDWEHSLRGAPALYDVFTLLNSALPAVDGPHGLSDEEMWTERFASAYFGSGRWADLYRDLLVQGCRGLWLPESDVWPQFVQFLLMRTHYFDERGGQVNLLHRCLLRAAAEHRGHFLMAG